MITDQAISTVACAVAAVLIYGILSRGLFRATDDLRQSLVELSYPLLDSERVADRQKRTINAAMDDVHSALSAWKVVFLLIVVIGFIVTMRTPKIRENDVPSHLRQQFKTFRLRWLVSVLGNSPAALLVFSLIAVVFFAFVSSLVPIVNLIMQYKADSDRDAVHVK